MKKKKLIYIFKCEMREDIGEILKILAKDSKKQYYVVHSVVIT